MVPARDSSRVQTLGIKFAVLSCAQRKAASSRTVARPRMQHATVSSRRSEIGNVLLIGNGRKRLRFCLGWRVVGPQK